MGILDDLSDTFTTQRSKEAQLAYALSKAKARALLGQQSAQSGLLGGPDPNSAVPDVNWSAMPQTAPTAAQVQQPDGSFVRAPNTQAGLLGANAPADQVTPGGLLGYTPDDNAAQRRGLLSQAMPEQFLSAQTNQAIMGPRIAALPGVTEGQRAAMLLDPKAGIDAYAKQQFPMASDDQKLADAIAALPEGDPRRAVLQGIADKKAFIPEKDPNKIAEMHATAIKNEAEAALAKQRGELLKTSGYDDDTLERIYQTYKTTGDLQKSIGPLPRGANAQPMMNAIQNYVTKRMTADKITPAQQAAAKVNLAAMAGAAKKAGERGANADMTAYELESFADQAEEALAQVGNSGFKPWNSIKNFTESQLSDPKLAALKTALQGVQGAYAGVKSRTGATTVEGMREADALLGAAQGPDALKAVFAQMKKEAAGVKASSSQVQNDILDRINPGGGANPAPAARAPAAPKIPPKPINVPVNSQYSPSRNQWRGPDGTIYDAMGQKVQ